MTRPLALAAGCALDASAPELIAAAGAAGFDAVSLRASGEHAIGDPVAIRAAATRAGVSIHDVEVHRIGSHHTDATQLLETAQAIGATSVLMVSDLDSVDDTVREVTRLNDQCHDLGLVLGLEYMDWTTPSTPAAAIDIARRTGCRLVVDVLHHIRVGAGVDELRSIVDADVLGWLQLCDAPVAGPARDDLLHEARHARLPPGHGGLPLTTLLAAVPDGVVVSVEVQSDRLAAEYDVTERALHLHDAAVRVLTHRG